jgi:hypothetical protein
MPSNTIQIRNFPCQRTKQTNQPNQQKKKTILTDFGPKVICSVKYLFLQKKMFECFYPSVSNDKSMNKRSTIKYVKLLIFVLQIKSPNA